MSKSIALPIMLAASLMLSGCDEINDLKAKVEALTAESGKWREESQKWKAEAQGLQQSAKAVSENMVIAADKVDPVAIKEIFRAYVELGAINDKLREEIGRSPGMGVGDINLGTQRLKAVVTRYSGALVLDGWLKDSGSGKFWDGIVMDKRDFDINLSNHADQWITWCISDTQCAHNSYETLGLVVYQGRLEQVHISYMKEANRKFDEFLVSGPHTTPEKQIATYLEGRLLKPGRHEIAFKATPKSAVWSTVIELGTENSVGEFKPFHKIYLGSENGRTTPDPVYIYVRFGSLDVVQPIGGQK